MKSISWWYLEWQSLDESTKNYIESSVNELFTDEFLNAIKKKNLSVDEAKKKLIAISTHYYLCFPSEMADIRFSDKIK